MCAVTSIVDRSVRSIESIDGRYGGCWRRSSPKPPSHKPRRRLNSSSTPGPVDCARAVWRETLSWVPFGAAPPQVTRLSPPTIPSKPPRSSSPGTTMLGQSPLTRARCGGGGARSLDRARGVWRLGGGGGGRLHRPSRALRAPRVTRVYAYVVTAHRARHRRFRSPRARPARARCCGGGARSLVRAEAEAVGLGVAFSYTARHARHARARARHHRASRASSPFLFPHAPTRARCDGGGARLLDSARGVWRLRWRWRAVEVAGGYIARHARYARRASRACTNTSSPRIAHVITVFRPPRARPARARCCGGGARSLARAEAEAVGLGVTFSYTARHARHARA